MAFMFEKLEVYQKAVALAADIAALMNPFPAATTFSPISSIAGTVDRHEPGGR